MKAIIELSIVEMIIMHIEQYPERCYFEEFSVFVFKDSIIIENIRDYINSHVNNTGISPEIIIKIDLITGKIVLPIPHNLSFFEIRKLNKSLNKVKNIIFKNTLTVENR